MLPIVVVLCVATPFVELAVLVWLLDRARDLVGRPGDLLVLAAFVALTVLGIRMLRRESWVPIQRVRESMWRRALPPEGQLRDALRLFGALLLALPGFVSGIIGLTLQLEVVRDLAALGFTSSVAARRGATRRRIRRERETRTEARVPFRAPLRAPLTSAAMTAPDTREAGDAGEADWESASVAGSTVERTERSEMEESFFEEEEDHGRWEMFAPEHDELDDGSGPGFLRRRKRDRPPGDGSDR